MHRAALVHAECADDERSFGDCLHSYEMTSCCEIVSSHFPIMHTCFPIKLNREFGAAWAFLICSATYAVGMNAGDSTGSRDELQRATDVSRRRL